jgi:glycosyltransferase involved in cell wall biosynthesis
VKGFVVFSDDWGGHPSSSQHLFSRIARNLPVVWVNTVMRWPRITPADLGKVAGKLSSWLRPRPPAPDGDAGPVTVLAPVLWPGWGFGPGRRFNRGAVLGALAPLVPEGGDGWGIVSTIPVVADVFAALPRATRVYYCVDEYAEWPGHARGVMTRLEARLLDHADLLVATATPLLEAKARPGLPARLLTHGVDGARFAAAAAGRGQLAGVGADETVVGFFGLVDERIDQELVAGVAAALPRARFVFLGEVVCDVSALNRVPNVTLLPPVPYAELPEAAARFDVCWLPYRINDLTKNINPLKLKEYLALERPVAAVPLPEVAALAAHVALAEDAAGFVAVLEGWIESPPACPEATRAFVAAEDWDAKARQFLAWVAGAADGTLSPGSGA